MITMVSRRKPRQKRAFLGRRRFGKGDVKNSRGSGNKGGKGNAGRCKHKGTWVAVYAPGYFGKYGFANPNGTKIPVFHLFDINQKAVCGKLEKKEGKFLFEFKGKVLSTGNATVPLLIRAASWSKRVEEKLKAAGGSIEKLEVQDTRPKTAKHETTDPKASKSEKTRLETSKPKTSKPETTGTKPETTRPDTARHETSRPETTESRAAKAEG